MDDLTRIRLQLAIYFCLRRGTAGLIQKCRVLDLEGRTIWIVDANGYGKHFVVRVDEILTAFLELQRAIHEFAVSLIA